MCLRRVRDWWALACVVLVLHACGGTDLDRAVRSGDSRGVLAAIEAGADIQQGNAHGITPLMAAARASQAEVAELLVDRGARVRARDKRGFTALHYAAQNGMTATVGLLLDRGAAINAPAGTGRYTALHLAVIASHDRTAGLLVERGADLAQRNAQGFTALEIAASRQEYDLAAALQDADAKRQAPSDPEN
jgi:uncharacterized protein